MVHLIQFYLFPFQRSHENSLFENNHHFYLYYVFRKILIISYKFQITSFSFIRYSKIKKSESPDVSVFKIYYLEIA